MLDGGHVTGTTAAPDSVLVPADELVRLKRELARLADAACEERRACRRIVEDQLRLMLEERRADPVLLVRAIIARIDERPDPTGQADAH